MMVQLAEALAAEYEVTSERAREDILALVASSQADKLVISQ